MENLKRLSAYLTAGLALAAPPAFAIPALAAPTQPPRAGQYPDPADLIPPIDPNTLAAVRALLEANQPPAARNNPAQNNAAPPAEPAPDAYLLLEQLIARIDDKLNALDKPQRDDLLLAISDAASFDRPQAVLPAAREGIALYEAAGAFESLDRIAATPRAMGEPSALISPDTDHFTLNAGSRNLARAAAARLVSAVEDGDQAAAAASYEHILAIARVHAQRLTAINRLTGDALITLANDRIRQAILRGDLHAIALDAAAEALDRQLAHRPPVASTIEMERLYLIASLDTLTPGGDPELLAPLRSAALDSLTDRFNAYKTISSVEPAARNETPEAAAAAQALRRVKPLPLPYMAAAHSITILPRLIATDDQIRTDIAATRLMIALERHRLRTGAYPDDLNQLVPAELDHLASPLGDSYGLIYEKRNDLYTLYSPGRDLKDNNAAGKVGEVDGFKESGVGMDVVYR